jgi:polar amino acid transport system substrate-binding protein
MTFTLPLAFAVLAATAPSPPPAAPVPPITVAWRDRPPYHYTENGVDKGVVLERARQAFADAGLAARFVKMPSKRIWSNFVSHTPRFCTIGWYRLPERELLGQFSVPILTDPPQIVLVAPAARAAVDKHATLAALLADPTLSVGMVDGVSYGQQLDTRIRAGANQMLVRTVDAVSMMRMVAAGRFSFTFSDVDDWRFAREHDPAVQAALRRDFPDMPPGLKRYIMCTKDVPAASMASLNRAIESGKAEPARRP